MALSRLSFCSVFFPFHLNGTYMSCAGHAACALLNDIVLKIHHIIIYIYKIHTFCARHPNGMHLLDCSTQTQTLFTKDTTRVYSA